MVGGIQQGRGTFGKLIASDEMYGKATATLDNVNGVVTDARAGKGTIGKLLNDPTLYDQAKKAVENGNSIIADVRNGKGFAGQTGDGRRTVQ